MAGSISNLFGKIFEAREIVMSSKTVFNVIERIGNAFWKLGKFGQAADKVLGKIVNTIYSPKIDKAQKVFSKVTKAFDIIKGIGGAVVDVLKQIPFIKEIFTVFEDFLKPVENLSKIFAGTLKTALMPAFMKLYEVLFDPRVIKAITAFAEGISVVLIPIIETIAAMIGGLIDLPDQIAAGWAKMEADTKAFGDQVTKDWNAFWAGFAEDPSAWLQKTLDNFADFWVQFVNDAAAAGTQFGEDWNAFWTQFGADAGAWGQELGVNIVNWLNNLGPSVTAWGQQLGANFNKFLTEFVEIGAVAWNWLQDNWNLLWETVGTGFKAFINFFIDMLNSFANTMNAWDTGNIFPDWGTIPRMYVGGSVRQTGIAVVDKGEVILNAKMLDSLSRSIMDALGSIPAAKNGPVYNNTINTAVVDTQTLRLLNRQLEREGNF